MIGSGQHPLFWFGLPPDFVAWTALLLGLVLLLAPRPWIKTSRWLRASRLTEGPLSSIVPLALLALLSGALSAGYFVYYLGGAPRIIDATAYLLEARSFAEGSFSFAAAEPTASFRGRFLIHTADDPTRLAVIFPPGYPALLSLGVLGGAYFLVGPLLGMALVLVTYALTLSLTARRRDALVAAALSTICACLRYHTAETMSHGLSALLTGIAVLSSVELGRGKGRKFAAFLGLSLGALLATRQLTGLLVGAACVLGTAIKSPASFWRSTAWVVLFTLPGVLLLLLHQRAVTGSFFVSPQLYYYSLADGPPGCFGLGLGSGCAYEHADVVARQGEGGLTLGWAMRNTLHRLHQHTLDIANFEPLVLVALLFLYRVRKRLSYLPLVLVLILVPLGYALFYFPGSYPGAGARFYAELLPVWQVLLAAGLCTTRLVRVGLFAALLGFAVHANFGHRELGSAHFGPRGADLDQIPSLVRDAMDEDRPAGARSPGPDRPLVFVSTAHEFNLAHLAFDEIAIARRTHDSREALLARTWGASSTFAYESGPKGPRLVPLDNSDPKQPISKQPHPNQGPFTFEAEFDYPPEASVGLWVHPEHPPVSCASQGRALRLHLMGDNPRLKLEVRGIASGTYAVTVAGVTRGKCVEHHLGARKLATHVELTGPLLRNLSHIDRLVLTPTHP